tara:strand:- start:885 stop:1304 length:420 start_codon:yes stop_codon:yes gene_type:complete
LLRCDTKKNLYARLSNDYSRKCDLGGAAHSLSYGGFHKNILEFSSKQTEKEVKMKIFDVVQPKETDKLDEQTGKPITRSQNLAIAFEKEGRITGIKLEALPLPDNKGEVWIRLFEQKPKENKSYGNATDNVVTPPWGDR